MKCAPPTPDLITLLIFLGLQEADEAVQKVLDELDLDFQEAAPAAGRGKLGQKGKAAEAEEEDELVLHVSHSSTLTFLIMCFRTQKTRLYKRG